MCVRTYVCEYTCAFLPLLSSLSPSPSLPSPAKEEVDTFDEPYDPLEEEGNRAQVMWMKSLRRIQTQVEYGLVQYGIVQYGIVQYHLSGYLCGNIIYANYASTVLSVIYASKIFTLIHHFEPNFIFAK